MGKWANNNLWGKYVTHLKIAVGVIGGIIALIIMIKVVRCLRKRQGQGSTPGTNVTVNLDREPREGRETTNLDHEPRRRGKFEKRMGIFPGVGRAIDASSLRWLKGETTPV